jgi:hypothetical protein
MTPLRLTPTGRGGNFDPRASEPERAARQSSVARSGRFGSRKPGLQGRLPLLGGSVADWRLIEKLQRNFDSPQQRAFWYGEVANLTIP